MKNLILMHLLVINVSGYFMDVEHQVASERSWTGGLMASKTNSPTWQFSTKDISSTHRRFKRSEACEPPMQVIQRRVYLQSGRAYCLPCSVIRPGDVVTVIFWFRGESEDATLRDLILRHVYPDDGQSFAVDDRYQISPSRGLIIDPVDVNDTDRYWCKTVRESSSQFVEDYLDVTVLDETFPEERDSIVSETSESMDIQSRNTIQCPLLPQLPTQTDFTVYWTIKNSSDGQSLDIIVAKFPDGEIMSIQKYTDTHSITDKNGLQVTRFGKRDEEYCCHVFENENDLRTACVDVTWLALMTQKHPSLEGCDSASQICNVEVTQHQDYLPLACYIHEVYPKPNLNWSYTNCERTPKFFTASTSTRNQTNESFNVKSTVYIVELKRSLELCSFTCTAYGDAITDQTRSSTVTIKRRNEITTTPSLRTPFTYTCPDCNESGFGVIVFLMVCLLVFDLGLFLLLVLPRSKAFLLNHALDFPTLPRFPRMCEFVLAKEKDSEPSGTQSSAQNPPTEEDETCLMISSPEESVMEQKEDPVCFVNHGNQEVHIADPKFKWKYVGDLIIKSFLDMRNRSGFKAIKDVICMEDGNMVVIDEKGMHHFTTEYHYRFIDLDQVLNHKTFVCFTNFAYDKLLFGLKLGKIVVVDMAQEQATNFASVTPAKGKEVQLACIAGGDSGFVFASDRNGRTISVFDQGGICFGRFETPSIQPSSLAVHIRKGIPGFFVTTEMLVRKYNVSGEKRQSMISHEHHLNIDKDFLMTRDFKPGHISVQGNELLVINHLDDTKSLQILHLNVNNGKFQNSTIAHAPGIRGVKFSIGDKVILYTDNSVHLLEKRTD